MSAQAAAIEAIRHEVRERLPVRMVSLRRMVENVRLNAPDCDLGDKELGELIAAHAVARGVQAIAFDLGQAPHELELAAD
jgi:hypothetical protein